MEIDRAVVESLFADATRCNCGAVLHAATSRIAHVYRLNGQRPGEQIRVRSGTVPGSSISSRWQLPRGGPAAMTQRSRGLGQVRPSSGVRISWLTLPKARAIADQATENWPHLRGRTLQNAAL